MSLLQELVEKEHKLFALARELGVGIVELRVSLTQQEIDILQKDASRQIQWLPGTSNDIIGVCGRLYFCRSWGR